MDKKDYIKTINVNGIDIELGLDDCGQCYYIEWIDENGEKNDIGLGTYNACYMEPIYYRFDPVYKSLSKKKLFGEELTSEESELLKNYQTIFDKEYQYDNYMEFGKQ